MTLQSYIPEYLYLVMVAEDLQQVDYGWELTCVVLHAYFVGLMLVSCAEKRDKSASDEEEKF